MQEDNEHLRLLSIFHYVVGGVSALFSLVPIIYIAMGVFMLINPAGAFPKMPAEFSSMEPEVAAAMPPAWFGWIFVVLGALFLILGMAFSLLIVFTGKWMMQRRHHTVCVVMGAIACAFFPFGTALGVFSLIVLNRSSVKDQFRLAAA